jgi:hypothetical protein
MLRIIPTFEPSFLCVVGDPRILTGSNNVFGRSHSSTPFSKSVDIMKVDDYYTLRAIRALLRALQIDERKQIQWTLAC